MNKAHAQLISGDSRSASLARICLAPAKTYAEAPGQCPKQRKATGTEINLRPLIVPSLTSRQLDGAAPS
jgi:hypothetical protein